MNKNAEIDPVTLITILLIISWIIVIFILLFNAPSIEETKDKKMCEDIDLTYIRTEKNLFSANVIICYDKEKKEIVRI